MQPNNTFCRRIHLSDTPNFRDLGGYATADGGVTKFGVFFRSACPNSLSASDKETLAKLNVTTAIDLRGGSNSDETMSGFVSPNIALYNYAIGTQDTPYYASDVPQSYLRLTQSPSFADVFATLALCSGAAVFHCFAGKDRTGVVAAVLLMLAGVSDEDIIADYTLSYAYFLKRIRQDFSRTDAENDVFKPLPDHMETFLQLFRCRYGTARNFLLQAGLTEDQLNALADKFVARAL